jgi:hypothetical protein
MEAASKIYESLEFTEQAAHGLARVALYARLSGLISMKRGFVRAAIFRANALRSLI